MKNVVLKHRNTLNKLVIENGILNNGILKVASEFKNLTKLKFKECVIFSSQQRLSEFKTLELNNCNIIEY